MNYVIFEYLGFLKDPWMYASVARIKADLQTAHKKR